MEATVDWLKTIEHLAMETYTRTAQFFEGDAALQTFLKHLADDEAWHCRVLENASKIISQKSAQAMQLVVDPDTKKRVTAPFHKMNDLMHKHELSASKTLDYIIEAESTEWNDIFLYVVNTLQNDAHEFKLIAPKVQHHLNFIDHFVDKTASHVRSTVKIKTLPKLWTESILIAEDSKPLSELFAAIVEPFGYIKTAENGQEALQFLQEQFYAVIITDLDMPVLNGLEFYKTAAKIYSDIHKRFIFVSGGLKLEHIRFLKTHQIRYLEKPVSVSALREAVSSKFSGIETEN